LRGTLDDFSAVACDPLASQLWIRWLSPDKETRQTSARPSKPVIRSEPIL